MIAATDAKTRLPRALTILLISLAGLLLEVGYTRIISFKLWYYYTYLVIGLALLGIGSGSVFVAVCAPVRRWSTDTMTPNAMNVAKITKQMSPSRSRLVNEARVP